jgi:hypothetical protein
MVTLYPAMPFITVNEKNPHIAMNGQRLVRVGKKQDSLFAAYKKPTQKIKRRKKKKKKPTQVHTNNPSMECADRKIQYKPAWVVLRPARPSLKTNKLD